MFSWLPVLITGRDLVMHSGSETPPVPQPNIGRGRRTSDGRIIRSRLAGGGVISGVSGEEKVVASSDGVVWKAAVSALRPLLLHGAEEERD